MCSLPWNLQQATSSGEESVRPLDKSICSSTCPTNAIWACTASRNVRALQMCSPTIQADYYTDKLRTTVRVGAPAVGPTNLGRHIVLGLWSGNLPWRSCGGLLWPTASADSPQQSFHTVRIVVRPCAKFHTTSCNAIHRGSLHRT